MKQVVQWVVAVLIAGTSIAPVFAQEAQKALPTLLIKGEVVSVDTSDPAATLLKVKDRYGFETPIFLTQDTKVSSSGQPATAADLKAGSAVEVEYNFDVNTAKRHAVNVAVSAASAAPATASTPAAATPEAPAETSAPSTEAPAAPEASAPVESAGTATAEQPAAE